MRRTYSKEYKLEAVRQCELASASEVARQLGIGVNLLYRWRDVLKSEGSDAFRGRGNLSEQEERIRCLEQENRSLKEDNEILKKATAYFAKHQK